MKSIAEFFARIQGKQAQKIALYINTQEIIAKEARIDVPIESITFSGKTLSLKGLDQAAKSVIFIKKSGILRQIKEKLPNIIVEDIRA